MKFASTFRILMIVILIASAFFAVLPVSDAEACCCPPPAYGVATVDGLPNEWGSVPVFAKLTQPGIGKYLADARLMYNCHDKILYVYVISVDGREVEESWAEAWIKLDFMFSTATPIEKAWVRNASGVVIGWEASYSVTEGAHYIYIHTNARDGAFQTARTDWMCFLIDCPPTAVTFSGGCAHRLLDGNIIRWETASEVGNRGFFVRYHPDRNGFDNSGVVNPTIIPSKGGVAGASYSYFDRKKPATGYYWVVGIDAYGISDVLGPIQLTDRPKATALVKVSTTTSLFYVTWTGPANEPYEVIIRSWTPEWKEISNVQTVLVPSGNELRLIPGLSKGYYDVKVKAAHGYGTSFKRFRVRS